MHAHDDDEVLLNALRAHANRITGRGNILPKLRTRRGNPSGQHEAPLIAEPEAESGLIGADIGQGFLKDYISGLRIKASPEELDAVQVFARRLVEDYGYSKERIQTRPQHRVRMRPSDEEKSYPVDIAVFSSDRKTEDELFMVVECKKKERKDAEHQ